jgi:hypothetical protein
METYKSVIGPGVTLVLSSDSDLFRYLKRAGGNLAESGVSPPPSDSQADSAPENKY